MTNTTTKTAIGICCHRFHSSESNTNCIIAGIDFDDAPGFHHFSDGDVVFFALLHAITSLTGIDIIEDVAKKLYERDGITDSSIYLQEALSLLTTPITSVSISLEAKKPRFHAHFDTMRASIAKTLSLDTESVGISCFSGDGLSDVSCGEGVRATALISV